MFISAEKYKKFKRQEEENCMLRRELERLQFASDAYDTYRENVKKNMEKEKQKWESKYLDEYRKRLQLQALLEHIEDEINRR